MHPLYKELDAFVEGRQVDPAIIDHINNCEFCRTYCERWKLLLDSVDSTKIPAQADLDAAAEKIFAAQPPAKIINLTSMTTQRLPEQRVLAADGGQTGDPELQNLATWFSQEQDIVVRVMRDTLHKVDFLQVIAPNDSLMSHVLVESVDSNHAFVTDEQGRAEFGLRQIEDLASIKWQIKLPEASFQLKQLSYDPEHIESQADTILTSPGGDKVSVKLVRKTEGKEIIVRVLALDGNEKYQKARVAIISKSGTEIKSIHPNDALRFILVGPDTEIDLRIFE
ncbi:MAG: hypothetical protein WBP29_11915 [Candidatus Zixiibacteriota bacterium]